MNTSLPGLLDKVFQFFEAVIIDEGANSLSAIAFRLNVPKATAYRFVSALIASGLLIRTEQGRYFPGQRLLDYARYANTEAVLPKVALPILTSIARRFRQVVHLGVLDDGMVTYLVKVGQGDAAAFTRQGMQLEAYCSGIGKVLLAHLSSAELEAYLSGGPFVPLTSHTITDRNALQLHLEAICEEGYAVDDEEVAIGLKCISVPIRCQSGMVTAAISLSASATWMSPAKARKVKDALLCAAKQIGDAV